jgi:hypothetical protein
VVRAYGQRRSPRSARMCHASGGTKHRIGALGSPPLSPVEGAPVRRHVLGGLIREYELAG